LIIAILEGSIATEPFWYALTIIAPEFVIGAPEVGGGGYCPWRLWWTQVELNYAQKLLQVIQNPKRKNIAQMKNPSSQSSAEISNTSSVGYL
jgi:hypothetical protein